MPEPASTPTPHPASATLAAEVIKKVRASGLVVWLDADGRYVDFVAALARGEHGFPYPVVGFAGSYLELMLALEPYGSGLDPDRVLIHLPGLNKEAAKQTPVFELYEAGSVFEKALGTVVREAAVGVARPDEVEAFLKGGADAVGAASGGASNGPVTLAAADAWLSGLRHAPRDRLTLVLENVGVDDVVMKLFAMDAGFREHLPAGSEKIFAFLDKHLGLGAAWRTYRLGDKEPSPTHVGALVASWLMAVEFVHDLKEDAATPELRALAKLAPPLVKEARRLVVRAREQHPDLYETYANELQDVLEHERSSHGAAVLGSVDTFRFEESAMRTDAFAKASRGQWSELSNIASARTTEHCFWVRRSTSLQRTWELLRLAGEAGKAMAATHKALVRCTSLDEATLRYAEELAPVDRLHRGFEQRAHALLSSDLEDHHKLLELRREVRLAYRAWADATNRTFHDLCVAEGPLPSASLRQRGIFDEEVRPLVEQGAHVAYFMVDALRFEMAQALASEIASGGMRAATRARLAELPTETVIGMNALAPVVRNGRLQLAQKEGAPAGFSTGEFVVATPADRLKAISQRVLKAPAEDFELEAFANLDLPALKARLRSKPPLLVVVRSRELDEAGEHNLHLGTFDQTLALLKTAIALLGAAGIERFVITSDHGFLLQDATVEPVAFGASKRAAQRRHALLAAPSGMADVLEVPLSALDYDVKTEGYLVFRADTAPWKVSEKVAPFVHGGNSLQERVIPVVVIERQRPAGKFLSKYEVVAWPEPAHLGRQRLRVAIRLQDKETATLGFISPRSIGLSLRVKAEGKPRDDVALVILDVQPPATLSDGEILVPPNREEAIVEFELTGLFDEKVRVEIFHPGGTQEVAPKVVEGFFDVARSRRLGKVTSVAPAALAAPAWRDLIDDPGYREIFQLLADRQVVNEEDLARVLGTPRRVRSFAQAFDELVTRIPFEVEIYLVGNLKAYRRRS